MTRYDEIILSLKIISQIPRNGRIRRTEKGRYTLEDDKFYTPFRRFLCRDGRESTMSDIEATLAGTFDYVMLLLDCKHVTDPRRDVSNRVASDVIDEARIKFTQVANLYRELGRSVLGLRNLKETTYCFDAVMVAKIEWAIERIQEQRRDMCGRFPTLSAEDLDMERMLAETVVQ